MSLNTILEDSSTYQATLKKGEDRGRYLGARGLLLRQGTKRFGVPTPAQETALNLIDNQDRLNQLAERLLDVASWEELLKN